MGQVDPTEESRPIQSHRGTLETTSGNWGVSGWVWVDGHGRNYLLRVLTATDRKRVSIGGHKEKRRLVAEVGRMVVEVGRMVEGFAFGHSLTLNAEKTLGCSWRGRDWRLDG
jgi:hypothetical protein